MSYDVQGISFPFRFSNLGGVARDAGSAKIKTNLRALVTSAVNERLIRKRVGAVGYTKSFRNLRDIGEGILEALILEAIATHERRIIVRELTVYTIDSMGGPQTRIRLSYTRKNGVMLDVADFAIE